MFLFKYVSNPDFILNDGYIRATQLSALNDPFEANYDKEGLIELTKHLDDIGMHGKQLIDYIEVKKHTIGVICFSESKDNLLMWAHYADEHKGALICFYFSDECEQPILPNLINPENMPKENLFSRYLMFKGQCLPVKYRKQPLYKIDKFDRDYSNVCFEGGDRILFEIFQQKSDEWIYEKEHRITLKLEQADKVILDDINKYKNIPFIENLLNKRNLIGKNILKCIKYDKKDKKKLHISLESIEDTSERALYGNLLSDLAKDNPNILYLFALSSFSLWSIAYGIKKDMKDIKDYSCACQNKYFETFKVKMDTENYTLKFQVLHH